jgi:hypothetical protein
VGVNILTDEFPLSRPSYSFNVRSGSLRYPRDDRRSHHLSFPRIVSGNPEKLMGARLSLSSHVAGRD